MTGLLRTAAALLLAAAVLLLPVPARADAPLRIGIVADSTAESCALPGAGICGYLEQLLTARGVAVSWHLAVVPGASCGGLVAAQASMLAAHSPDLVVIMCG